MNVILIAAAAPGSAHSAAAADLVQRVLPLAALCDLRAQPLA